MGYLYLEVINCDLFNNFLMKVPISVPFIEEEEIREVLEVLKSGWLVQGKKNVEFENLFRNFTGSRYALSVSNCTTALYLCIEALEIQGKMKKGKIIVPSFTFIATANAVESKGYQVVFCDVKLNTYNIDERKIVNILEKEKNIEAIIPVNLFGLCANLPKIVEIGRNWGLKIIEDSACALGSYVDGIHSGNFGDCGCFSFHPRKTITTGEGGMIVTNNKELYEILIKLRNHGSEGRNVEYILPEYDLKGYNARITDIQAALGIAQMKKIDYILEKRKEIAAKYIEFFKNTTLKDKEISKYLRIPEVDKNYIHSYQSFVVLFTLDDSIFDEKINIDKKIEIVEKWSLKRNKVMEYLYREGISTRQGTHAVHNLKYYKNKYNLKPYDYINSYILDKLTLALPIYPQLSNEDFYFVCEKLYYALRDVV